jgi:hypothetical protein
MVDSYSLNALTTAKKEAAARMAREAQEKRKTRAAQIAATRELAAADAEVCAPQKNEKASVALEAKALGGGEVEIPATHVAITAKLRVIVKFSGNCINALEHECH